MTRLSALQLDQYATDGFVILPGFAGPEVTDAMLSGARDIASRKESGGHVYDALSA